MLAPGIKMEFELVKLSNSRNESLFEDIEEFNFRAFGAGRSRAAPVIEAVSD